jgi:hypothetical protein
MAEVVSRVLDRKDIRANQITISLNHPWGVYQQEDIRNHSLNKFLVKVINDIQRRGDNLETEIHFTVADMSIETYKAWKLWDPITSVADSISISVDEFKTDLDACYKDSDFRLCKFNCNLQMTPRIVKLFENPEFLQGLLRWYDTIYMIAHKPILDGEYSKLHTESIRKTVEIYNELPKEHKKNIFIDKCVEACAKSQYTCEAGTNIMTVWPDGRIIGCPYATHGGNKPQNNTPDQIIKSMVAMRDYADGDYGRRHYFNRCKMRKLWKNIQE